MSLLLIAGVLLAASGVPGLLLPWRSVWGPRVATLGVLLAAGLGIAGCAAVLSGAPPVWRSTRLRRRHAPRGSGLPSESMR